MITTLLTRAPARTTRLRVPPRREPTTQPAVRTDALGPSLGRRGELMSAEDFQALLAQPWPPPAKSWIPCNEGFANAIGMVQAVLRELDNAHCLVVGIEVRFQAATIRLSRPPPDDFATPHRRSVCTTAYGRGEREHVVRGQLFGVTVEWRDPEVPANG